MLAPVIPHIIDQHAEEAAFLWLLRNNAIHAPHYDLEELAALDERVEAHMDGLRIGGEYAWNACLENLQFKEPGEMFAAAMLAFEGDDAEKVRTLYRVAEDSPECLKGLISALGWIDKKHLSGKIRGLLEAKNPLWRYVGIATCAIHRVDSGTYLEDALDDKDKQVVFRALKATGELARVDLEEKVTSCIKQDSQEGRFTAAWSSALLGNRTEAVRELAIQVHQQTPFALKSGQILFRVVSMATAKQHLADLIKEKALRDVIQYIGVLGEVSYVPWLIEQMEYPEFARVSGEAFSLITGVDLAYDDLECDQPEDFQAGPTEDAEDENTDLDIDEDLPWPDKAVVMQWWLNNQTQFVASERYLMGKPIDEQHCLTVLKKGKQRQREAAALELALMNPTTQLFEIRANAKQQQVLLGHRIK